MEKEKKRSKKMKRLGFALAKRKRLERNVIDYAILNARERNERQERRQALTDDSH